MRKIAKTVLALFAAALFLPAAALPEQGGVAAYDARMGVVTVCDLTDGARGATVPFFQEQPLGPGIIGSGIVVSADGLILTAGHIVPRGAELSVVLWDFTEYRAEVVASDRRLDIAVLKINNGDLHVLPWRLAEPPTVGETVYAIGTPTIFTNDPVASISGGIISGVHRALGHGMENWAPYMLDLIETDAQITPGQSGGALVDAQGRLLGMCMAVYYPAATSRGKAFAMPADEWLRTNIDMLVSEGHASIGSLGVQALMLSPERARRLGLQALKGVQVSSVSPGGPFDRAGVLQGDIVTRINGEPVRLVNRFRQIEMRLKEGSLAKVAVYRQSSNQSLQFDVTVAAEAAPSLAVEPVFDWRGMRLKDITEDMRRKSLVFTGNGVYVEKIDAGSKAYEAGIRAGDVILEVNDVVVKSLLDFRKAVETIPFANIARIRTTDGIGHVKGETAGR